MEIKGLCRYWRSKARVSKAQFDMHCLPSNQRRAAASYQNPVKVFIRFKFSLELVFLGIYIINQSINQSINICLNIWAIQSWQQRNNNYIKCKAIRQSYDTREKLRHQAAKIDLVPYMSLKRRRGIKFLSFLVGSWNPRAERVAYPPGFWEKRNTWLGS